MRKYKRKKFCFVKTCLYLDTNTKTLLGHSCPDVNIEVDSSVGFDKILIGVTMPQYPESQRIHPLSARFLENFIFQVMLRKL